MASTAGTASPSGGARAPRQVSLLGLAAAAAALAAALLTARAAGAGEDDAVQTFVLVFSSIVIEALPFVLMGAFVAAAIAVYVPSASSTGSPASRCRCSCPASP
jgi:uncharacterized membrane protein YraQ (UPF0718 family)